MIRALPQHARRTGFRRPHTHVSSDNRRFVFEHAIGNLRKRNVNIEHGIAKDADGLASVAADVQSVLTRLEVFDHVLPLLRCRCSQRAKPIDDHRASLSLFFSLYRKSQ